ncbi:rRNA adenine N-6-methyltransferase family protein, partial [Adlercreutzia sp. DFI.6.23]|uniref:rRNA adenine N-6-methyltransferase family protein n=1 Tax=Adlercreutzia sp. DFI.6.23 TaxID=2963705 RepID=UPI00272F7A42
LDSVTIMVQKEVADRMAAAVGTKNYGAYTGKLGWHAEPAGRFPVGPGNFFPPPRVDSAVIRLNRRVPLMADGAPATPEVIAAAALIADDAFANRR